MVACAILYLARKKLCLEPWPQSMTEITKQDIGECQEIVREIELMSNDYMNQLTPGVSAMTMTVSPVKVPPAMEVSNSFRTPPIQSRPIRIHISDQSDADFDLQADGENVNPLKGQKAMRPLDVSPYSVAIPSPLV
jgi:hypothetical protein